MSRAHSFCLIGRNYECEGGAAPNDRRSTSYLHQDRLRPFAARMFDETRGSVWVHNGL
jgi:hypothetical protein